MIKTLPSRLHWSETCNVSNILCSPDGLIDCVDPDCCEQLSCGSDPLCHGSADPLALLQQSPLPASAPTSTHTHTFYRRIRFLLGKAATHTLPGDVPFDTRYATCLLVACAALCVPAHSSTGFAFARLCPWIVSAGIKLKGVNCSLWSICVNKLRRPLCRYLFNERACVFACEWGLSCVGMPLHTSQWCCVWPGRLGQSNAPSAGVSVRLQLLSLCLLRINALSVIQLRQSQRCHHEFNGEKCASPLHYDGPRSFGWKTSDDGFLKNGQKRSASPTLFFLVE